MKPFTVALAKNQQQTGIAISEHLFPIGKEDGSFDYIQLIGVLWEDHRSPSPSYHKPIDLAWLDVPSMFGGEDEEDDVEDEGEEVGDEDDDADTSEDDETEYEEDDEGEVIGDTITPIKKVATA